MYRNQQRNPPNKIGGDPTDWGRAYISKDHSLFTSKYNWNFRVLTE